MLEICVPPIIHDDTEINKIFQAVIKASVTHRDYHGYMAAVLVKALDLCDATLVDLLLEYLYEFKELDGVMSRIHSSSDKDKLMLRWSGQKR